MTAKDQNLYKAVLQNISNLIPQFQPAVSMSDWEAAPRNAVKETYPIVQNYGCWFHFSQRIWQKTQKLGLTQTFAENQGFATYVRCLMAIPFPTHVNICVVCLNPRTTTWLFLPCKHANCCTTCSEQIQELGQPCPICRTPIENSFQIYSS